MREKKSKEIKNKKKRKPISLLLGLVLFITGGLFISSPFVPVINGLIQPIYRYTVPGQGQYHAAIPGAFLAFLGLFILLTRRRKPFSLILVPYMAFMYASVLVAVRFLKGEPEPAFIMERLSARPALVFLVLILEAILFMLLIVITSSLNARAEKRRERKKMAEERAAQKTEEEVNGEEKPAEEKSDRLEPIAFPTIEKLPTFTTFSSADIRPEDLPDSKKEEVKEKDADHIYDAPTASLSAFQSAKERISAAPAEEKKPRSSMLSNSLERAKESGEDINLNQGPIIGFEDKREKKSEDRVPSSIAPSGLSKKHPRYEMFASLQKKKEEPEPKEDDKTPDPPSGQEKSSVAPSGLSRKHPRYEMFEALSRPRDTSSMPSRPFAGGENTPASQSVPGPEVAASLSDAIRMRKRAEDQEALLKAKEEKEREDQIRREEDEAAERMKLRMIEEERARREQLLREQYRKEAEERVRRELAEQGLLKEKADDVHELPRSEGFYMGSSTAKPINGAEITDPEPGVTEDSSSGIEFKVGIGGLASNNAGESAIIERQKRGYTPPTADLLKSYPEGSYEIDEKTRELGELMRSVMHDFRVEVTLINIIKGPTVTMYEYDLAPGIMVSKVTSLQDNISMRIGGKQIRILAPVPGKSAIGIEVPNEKRMTVGFRELLDPLRQSGYNVPMILGRNILGQPMMLDVAKTPHLLIAGTTGSGKSVCINGLIVSILYTKSPKEVRLIMVDPKVVELQVYNRIPHLLTPVITEPKRVLKMLSWLVDEMERRYRVFSQIGTRNIEGFNANVHTMGYATEKMPYIVLIMDEFADLMTVIGKDIEGYVSRLMAKARAAGIHVVMATQRPSSEVITGTIKNNIPSRISFAVSSAMNSRIILDESGAENLLGRGDMLYLANGSNSLSRIQGAFLSDDEVDKVVRFVKSQGEPDYLDESIFEDEPEDEGPVDEGDFSGGDEDMYEKAKQIVFERKGASASYLQRRLGIGYNRAAKLVEQMEEEGIVGPANGSKPREILRYE
ncbi:MAG: DNA translocase FtsK [Bullifex sp.]